MRVATALSLFVCVAAASPARGESPIALHVLAIGYNGVPAATQDHRLRELRYADDDAAAFAEFARDMGGEAIVLSNLDVDTSRRFPDVAGAARPPLREEVRRAVLELNEAFARDRAHGKEPVVLLTYSGHGSFAGGQAALTLADGELTHAVLYGDVLTALSAAFVHVVVDACHAEAVVRPRDTEAQTVTLQREEVAAQFSRATLRGLPHVGALVASSAGAQTHEWDRWQHGVFTHEVLSGLRGAADVNSDRRIEYSEMAAFLSAVNREVADRGARVRALVTAPAGAPRTPIADLRDARLSAFLVGGADPFGPMWVETQEGQRVADLHSEHEHRVRLLVPSRRRLFVRNERGEARVTIDPGREANLDALAMQARGMRARGSLDVSLERGLFAAEFGPSYYRGFVDRTDEQSAVPLSTASTSSKLAPADAGADVPTSRLLAWTAVGVSGALLAGSASFAFVALDAKNDFDDANGLEQASRTASDRYDTYRTLSIGALVSAAVTGGLAYVLFQQE